MWGREVWGRPGQLWTCGHTPATFLVPVTAHWEQFSSAMYAMSGISNMFLEVVGDVL